MKIIKKTATENKEELNELFGKKKKAAEPAPAPNKPGINREWDEHYKTLEYIRRSGVSPWLAGGYFVADSGLPEELAQKIWFSWIENYDTLADKFGWNK
jgi:hypothetical protein